MPLYRYIKKYYKSTLFAFFILTVSLYPFKSDQAQDLFSLPHLDKAIHFLLYGILTFLFLTEKQGKHAMKTYIFTVSICLIFGGIVELIQMTQTHRSGDVYDLIANFSGSIFAIPVYILIQKIIK